MIMQFLSQARCVCVPRLWTNCAKRMCLVSVCPFYTSRRFSEIFSKKPKSPPFLRWCEIPWAPTRLPLRCWRWRRCRRVSPSLQYRHPVFRFDLESEFSPSSNCWSCRWRCWFSGRIGLGDCCVSAMRASVILRHCFDASANSCRCRRRFWCPSAFKWRTWCLALCGRSALVDEKSCLSRAMRSKSMTSFSPILCSANDLRCPSCANHLARIGGWTPCFDCLALSSISFTLRNMICRSDALCFGPRLEFLSMAKPGIEVESRLVFWSVVGLREYFKMSPATAINDTDFCKRIAIKTLKFCRILARFEDLCAVQTFEYFLWFLAEPVDLLLLTHVFKELFLTLMFSNISISFVTLFCRRASGSFTVEIDILSIR